MSPYHLLLHAYEVVKRHIVRRTRLYITVVVFVVIGIPAWAFALPPLGFPTDARISIPDGESAVSVGTLLEEEGLIASADVFWITVRLFSLGETLKSGTYQFERPIGVAEMIYRIATGNYGIALVRVTIPEGYTVAQMATSFDAVLPEFDTEAFIAKETGNEGYLFPETYIFTSLVTNDEIAKRMRDQFYIETASIQEEIDASGHSLKDIVIMASLLEREARTLEERRMIADILWRRLADEYPLQVDAVFGYIQGRETFHPSLEDLKVDSPYNTYRNIGLPPGPIANPGLESLLAAVTPTPNEYWYYLTGDDGNMYYGKTFEEHKKNRSLYLD